MGIESVLESVEERLAEIEDRDAWEADSAQVQTNAPLALIQTSLESRHSELESVKQILEREMED